ncbi:MAG: hypothetical protein KDJ15_02195 [Alphaproteobacteria bacterium]|nr:hypothetical protein [Alphaproteobacteria bacterium]
MSKTPEDMIEWEAAFAAMHPRFAYTLNNDQPVRCTIIGDQPLFYMEDEDIIEDDFDDLFGMDAIEGGLLALGQSIDIARRQDRQYAPNEADRHADFLAAAAEIAGPKQAAAVSSIEDVSGTLEKSRLGKALTDFAAAENITICHGTRNFGASYDRAAGTIFINRHLDRADQVLLLARELRRAWQDKKGALLPLLTLDPDHAILVNRAQIADLQTMMIRTAWELQLAGEKAVWARVEESSLSDLGEALAREAYMDFRTLNNGTACAAAFEFWFLSERCQSADHKLIQQMLMQNHKPATPTETDASSSLIGFLTALGTLPFGKNYLAPYAAMILSDPLFTEVRDRSNANFLWFIKFERTFRETEQGLQESGSVHSRDFSRGDSRNDQERIRHDDPHGAPTIPSGSARIIPFPGTSGR